MDVAELVKSVVEDVDMRISYVHSSQLELMNEMERLSAELELFLASTDAPPIQECVDKLVVARQRTSSIHTTLLVVRDRLERLLLNARKRQQLQQQQSNH